jgi:hypothetical protein
MADGNKACLLVDGTLTEKEISMMPRILTTVAATTILSCITPFSLFADEPKTVTFLDQGWSGETRELFYFTPQGSRIIPYAWFIALEIADGSGMFSNPTYLERYGFIPPDRPHPLNPAGLPIGFAIDPVEVFGLGRHLGLNCAACHTGNVKIDGKTIRIDGGPASLDMDRFYADLEKAVTRTFFDPDVFNKFAARVLADPSPTAVGDLRQHFGQFQATIAGDAAVRHPMLESGFGRVDALAQSINALAVTGQGDPGNLRLSGAPTSYPYLWLAPDLEFVQWNPIAASPIGRNGGEVLGVFGKAILDEDGKDQFKSSILINELRDMENWLSELRPPKWTSGDGRLFPPIADALAQQGEALFKEHCAACHNAPPYRRTDPAANHFKKTFIEIGRVDYREIGTDPKYIDAIIQWMIHTNEVTAPTNGGQMLVPAATYFLKTVGEIVGRELDRLNFSDAEKVELSGYRLRPPSQSGGKPESYVPASLTSLKAGPLPGIWASGPFLHNGSVPTIMELLSPVEERRTVFWTGGRELDQERLGFQSYEAPGLFRFDTSLPGNRNTGHLYPPQGLSSDERRAIIEYLKSL